MLLARLAASLLLIGLVAALLLLVDLGAVLSALDEVSLGHVMAGLLLVQVQIVVSAARWHFTAARLSFPMSRLQAVREYYVATAVNQLAPGGVAGDALRAFRLRDGDPGGLKRSAKTVVFERLSGQMSFFAFFAVGLFFWRFLPGQAQIPGGILLPVTAILAGLIVALVLVAKRYQGLGMELHAVFVSRYAWAVQAALSVTVMLAYVGLFMLTAHAVGAPLPPVGALTIVPASLLVMLIPTGLGGWGTREAAAAALWPIAGLSAADGVAASLVYGALALVGAIPGLVILLLIGGWPGSRVRQQLAQHADEDKHAGHDESRA
ncbi:lysylphosphatidylglycerol synthase transmembrane domain-containing protein [Pararhizobium antarcticum]|uniref:lysylphosphatidylglycerol synthase transmembrane domain-containing protein n=1 Tax=Pararhizobium antarcticum TaxID=1798805 RepID=UPI0008FFDC62|nr:lysylphosphatidylglycerol synthase transmembrane domain-containing protein [Pararhizobium antarcticum]